MLRGLFARKKPKVFGLGLSKTGTTTLGVCLRGLGYKHTSYDAKLLEDWADGHYDRIWRKIDRCDTFEDWPYPLMFAELMERFGRNAHYILTVRKDARTWLESFKKHAMRQPPGRARQRRIAYGVDYPQLDEKAMLARYEQHISDVREFAAKLGLSDRLRILCWERGDGWRELCEFLDKPLPDRPFPHENRTMEPNEEVFLANQRVITLLAKERA